MPLPERTPIEHRRLLITMSTTHVDRHGERMKLQALEGLVAQINQRPIPMHVEHDLTTAPVGRVTRAWVEQLDDGEYAARAECEVFGGVIGVDVDDEHLASVGGRLHLPPAGGQELSIEYDPRNYEDEDVNELVNLLSDVGMVTAAHRLRKAVLPPPELIIGFTLLSGPVFWFSKGFFTRLGEKLAEPVGDDLVLAYEKFKEGVASVLGKRQPPDAIPALMVQIPVGEALIRGSVKTTNPSTVRSMLDAVEDLYRRGLVLLNEVGPDNVQVVAFDFQPATGQWEFSFLVEQDGNVVIASEQA